MKRNLVNCLVTTANIEVTMSFQQWKAYTSGDINLAQIKMINDVELQLSKLNINTYKIIVTVIASTLFLINNNNVALAAGIDSIQVLGNKFLDIVRNAMYWVCLVKGCLDVGKEVTRGGDNLGNIGKIIMKYTLAFGTLYILPSCFDMVRDTFAE